MLGKVTPWKSLWRPSRSQGHGVSRVWVSSSLSLSPNLCASMVSPCGLSCIGGATVMSTPTAEDNLGHSVWTWSPEQLSGTSLQTQTSIPEHVPPADTLWACLRVVSWAQGTLFSSKADEANVPFVRTFSLWLEASGCCCNTNGQINWHSHPGFEYKHWKWHDNFVMLTPQLGIRRKETKILELSSPRSWRTWSQIWSLWQCGFCTQLKYTRWFIFNCRLIHGKTSESIWYFWQNPGPTEASNKLPMTSMGPCFKALFLPSQYNSTFANYSNNFWLLLKRDIINRRIFLVGSSNDCSEESLI